MWRRILLTPRKWKPHRARIRVLLWILMARFCRMPAWKMWQRHFKKEGWLFKRGSKPVTSLLHFFQFLHPDRSRAANRKMHQINLGVIDLRLPTPVAFSSPVKFVEGNFPDKANHARLTSRNDS